MYKLLFPKKFRDLALYLVIIFIVVSAISISYVNDVIWFTTCIPLLIVGLLMIGGYIYHLAKH